ncbi:hypothetical protein MNB_SM-7-1190 [hydrothermal vent metagenome]|uniref:Uncharacterized protein n=1 Tax=hydrothermal vent metagenome TaxID=652676 RepID=A0A1W1BEP4_9ZZZZ
MRNFKLDFTLKMALLQGKKFANRLTDSKISISLCYLN